jgi:hypothetical protein
LTLPVLAIGGAEGGGEGPGNTMRLVADDVQGMVLPGAGHWVAEQAPEELLAALTAFLARTGTGADRGARPPRAACCRGLTSRPPRGGIQASAEALSSLMAQVSARR